MFVISDKLPAGKTVEYFLGGLIGRKIHFVSNPKQALRFDTKEEAETKVKIYAKYYDGMLVVKEVPSDPVELAAGKVALQSGEISEKFGTYKDPYKGTPLQRFLSPEELGALMASAEKVICRDPSADTSTRVGAYVQVRNGLSSKTYFMGIGREDMNSPWKWMIEFTG